MTNDADNGEQYSPPRRAARRIHAGCKAARQKDKATTIEPNNHADDQAEKDYKLVLTISKPLDPAKELCLGRRLRHYFQNRRRALETDALQLDFGQIPLAKA